MGSQIGERVERDESRPDRRTARPGRAGATGSLAAPPGSRGYYPILVCDRGGTGPSRTRRYTETRTFGAYARVALSECGSGCGADVLSSTARTSIRSPGRPKMLSTSDGSSPVLPNQCGT